MQIDIWKKSYIMFSVVLSIYLSFVLVHAQGVIDLPKTGQITSYYFRDDGDIRAGVAWPVPRFSDNGDGTITDNLTGLIWLKDANCIQTNYLNFPPNRGNGQVEWAGALDFVTSINNGTYPKCAAGHSDWRLPNINELDSLLTAGGDTVMWLRSQGFINFYSNGHWSSTTDTLQIDNAYIFNPYEGTVIADRKANLHWVWPVRGNASGPARLWKTGQSKSYYSGDDGYLQEGVTWPLPRFLDHGNNTITDKVTGLMWTKNAGLLVAQIPWQNAMDYVAKMNLGTYANYGYFDWRLPNRREMMSLINHGESDQEGWLNSQGFVNFHDLYWSSTSIWMVPETLAYVVDIREGGINWFYGKTSSAGLWPVRSGQIEEDVSIPKTPNGPTSVTSGASYSYSTGNSTSNFGHLVEYQFDWKGDGTDLSQWGSATQSKTWTSIGTYIVRARTRCTIDIYVISNWSSGLSVSVTAPTETVSNPTTLGGPTNGNIGTSYIYSTGGSSSNLGHNVQYLFDWGDGTNSGWLPALITSASHSWSSSGTYLIQVQARCATHNDVVSSWFGPLSLNISSPTLSYSVATNPSGLHIAVDGVAYTAPQTFYWTPGSTHALSVFSPQNGTSGTQYVFSSWSDGGAQTHNVNTPSSGATYTANLTTQYSLTTSVNPFGAGTVNPSGTNWYDRGQVVTITATPNSGYLFFNWAGDLSGNVNTTSITMDSPKNGTANFGSGSDLTGSWTTPLTQACRTAGKNQRCSLKGTFTVSNVGNKDAPSTTVKFYLSDNTAYEEGDTQLKSVATGKLKLGKSKGINFNLNLATNKTATGKYLIAVIDKDNLVTEIDKGNNIIIYGPIP